MFGRTNSAKSEARKAKRDHNARFNNSATDPNSSEYLTSHDQVVAAEKAAKKPRRS
ncbi:hypothetical protein [Streptomyces sp. NBC_01361]|uniref:hypothetical protein n=1 Tax=Streptomyces sp. NBC_01361 TaxID=2903838 RepID=UPI002E32E021|nr:hypothetical protein [Streptomyces sp. NBC_01361]